MVDHRPVAGHREEARWVMSPRALDPFWVQLRKNIGRSVEYDRFVVVEPTCALFGKDHRIQRVQTLDYLSCTGNRGTHAAGFLDRERSEYLDQWLTPYLESKDHQYLVLSQEFPSEDLDQDYPPSVFLHRLSITPQLGRGLLGLGHYHPGVGQLSTSDVAYLEWFARSARSHGLRSMVGVVVSDRDPLDTLAHREGCTSAQFVDFMAQKAEKGKVDIIARAFDGSNLQHHDFTVSLEDRE
jgi:hypothetical protein